MFRMSGNYFHRLYSAGNRGKFRALDNRKMFLKNEIYYIYMQSRYFDFDEDEDEEDDYDDDDDDDDFGDFFSCEHLLQKI